MAKGPRVTDEVEALIANVYREHPKWKAPMVRAEVSFILRKANPKRPPDWPSLSTVQKVLAIVRRKAKELPDNPQDKPWSIATLNSDPIPPQALPVVLEAYRQHIEKGSDFTIRQAKWVSRLSATELPGSISGILLADEIAKAEQLYDIIDRFPDLGVYDKLLVGLKAESKNLMPLWVAASVAGILSPDPTRRKKQEGKQ